MSSARQAILSTTQEELWAIRWNAKPPALVTRNLRRSADIATFPAIFIASHLDDVTEHTAHGKSQPPINRRDWELGIVTFLEGSTEELAPDEIEAFQSLVQTAMWKAAQRLGCEISEGRAGDIWFPDFGNNAIAQGLLFDVKYREKVDVP